MRRPLRLAALAGVVAVARAGVAAVALAGVACVGCCCARHSLALAVTLARRAAARRCGRTAQSTPAALKLQREDLVAASHALRSAQAPVARGGRRDEGRVAADRQRRCQPTPSSAVALARGAARRRRATRLRDAGAVRRSAGALADRPGVAARGPVPQLRAAEHARLDDADRERTADRVGLACGGTLRARKRARCTSRASTTGTSRSRRSARSCSPATKSSAAPSDVRRVADADAKSTRSRARTRSRASGCYPHVRVRLGS